MDWQIFWVPVCIVLLCYVIVLHVKVKKMTMQKKKISEQAEAYRKICIRLKEAQKEDEPELDSQLEVLGYETCEKKQKNVGSSVILEELRQQRQQLTVMLEDAIAESRYLEDTLSKLDNRDK